MFFSTKLVYYETTLFSLSISFLYPSHQSMPERYMNIKCSPCPSHSYDFINFATSINIKDMKLSRLIFALFLTTVSFTMHAQQYRKVWVEHFKGSKMDTTSWSKIPRGTSDWNRHMSDHESLYDTKKGKMILYGRVNEGIIPEDTARYITGGIYTKGKKTLTYGKVEVKARLHGAKGEWPAIWMLPEEGRWPDGGEIDIMERLNHDTIAYQTVHSYYTYVLKEEGNPQHGATGEIDSDDYNIYSVEILPDSLVFAINGKRTFTYPKIQTEKKGQYPFGTPYYLLIDMQIEGSWVGKADPKDYPVMMEIDWVKFYELK